MAKANLPVNFKDDILKQNMNGKRRFKIIQNSDGTVSFDDVTDYAQVGSTFGAAQINATNEAVNNAADASKIMDDLETIKANTQSGYIAGALAVKALSSNLKSNEITKISGNTINGGATLQEMCVLNCEGKSVIEFTPIGHGNYGNGIIALSVYGANTLNEAMHGNYNISCTDRELIQTINFNSGTKYSVNISGYKYVSFSAKNNNDAYAFVDLTHVQLS